MTNYPGTYFPIQIDGGRLYPIAHKNQPSVAGQLKWAKEIEQRISWPVESFKTLKHPYVPFTKIFFTNGLLSQWGVMPRVERVLHSNCIRTSEFSLCHDSHIYYT